MIVKVFANKGGGSAGASLDYLLGKDRLREGAEVIKGDPELSLAIAESLEFQNKYTVGCLSFEEKELPEKAKAEIMDKFEKTIFAGMEREQYNITWVEHNDKGRVELNYFIPNVEMTTGKRFQPYFDRSDRALVDSFKKVINHEYGLSSPDDVARKQLVQINPRVPKSANELKKELTDFFVEKIGKGELSQRSEIIDTLKDVGLEISRVTANSISIKNPEEGGRNIRLTGEIYKEEFYDSIEQSKAEFGKVLEREESERETILRSDDGADFEPIRAKYERCIASRSQKHEKLYPKIHNEPDRTVSDYFTYIDTVRISLSKNRNIDRSKRQVSESERGLASDSETVRSIGEREDSRIRGRADDLHSERFIESRRIHNESQRQSADAEKVKGIYELLERARSFVERTAERVKSVVSSGRNASEEEQAIRERVERLQAEREQPTGVGSRKHEITERTQQIDEFIRNREAKYSEFIERSESEAKRIIADRAERNRAETEATDQSIIGFKQQFDQTERAITRTERRTNTQKEKVSEHIAEIEIQHSHKLEREESMSMGM